MHFFWLYGKMKICLRRLCLPRAVALVKGSEYDVNKLLGDEIGRVANEVMADDLVHLSSAPQLL